MINRREVHNVGRLRNELVDSILDTERLVQFACHRVERTVCRLVDGRARTAPEPRVLRHRLVGALLYLFDLELARGPARGESRTTTSAEGTSPRVQRVVLEHFEHRHDHVGPLAEDAQRLLRTPLEDALRARVAHAVDHVARQPERNAFRDAQQLSLGEIGNRVYAERGVAYLVKGDAQVNVHDLARPIVHQNVGDMAVTQTQDMAHDRRRRDAPYVVESRCKPRDGRFVLLGEKVPHHGCCLGANVLEVCNQRVLPALITLSCLSEAGLNVGMLGVIGTISCEKEVNEIHRHISI